MRNYTHEELEAHCRKLWDTQWMNVVNHDNCYYGWDKGEAINHAVKMAEDYMRENFDAYVATLRQQAEQPSDDEPRLFSYDATGNRESVRVRWPGVDDVLTYVLEAEQPGVVVSDEVIAAFERAMKTCNGPLVTQKANDAAAWDAVSFFQSHAKAVAPLLRAPAEQGGTVDEPIGHPRSGTDTRDEIELFLRDAFAAGCHAAQTRSMLLATTYANREAPKLRAALAQGKQARCGTCGDVIKPDHLIGTTCGCADAALARSTQPDDRARLQLVIERDRTVFCGLIVQLKRELQSRAWLGDENARAAGGYTYDEPGFIREFGDACTAIMGALERAHRTFQDFTDCPSGEAIRNAQADAQAILDRHAERARVPDSVNGQAIELLIAGGYVTRNKAMDAIDIARAAAPSQPEGSVVCWACQASMTRHEHGEADGFCPKCGAEIELDVDATTQPEDAE